MKQALTPALSHRERVQQTFPLSLWERAGVRAFTP